MIQQFSISYDSLFCTYTQSKPLYMLQLIDVLLQMCIPCGTSSGQWCLDPPALCCSQHYYQLVCTVINHLHMRPIWSPQTVADQPVSVSSVSVSSHSIRLIELVNAMKRIQKQNNYPSFTFHIPSRLKVVPKIYNFQHCPVPNSEKVEEDLKYNGFAIGHAQLNGNHPHSQFNSK